MGTDEEKRNQRKGMYFSLGIHGALLILFFFILAWKEPFPPIQEYGIELNFGIDNQGSGTVQQAITSHAPTEQPEEDQSEVQPELGNEELVEETKSSNDPSDEPSESIQPADQPAEDIQSPDIVEETDQSQAESTITENHQLQVTENTQPIADEKTEINTATGANQGDGENEAGDKGDPEGEIDERALYGNPGTGAGASLDMTGWIWDYIPKPNDQSEENGRIVFTITIDDAGEILSIRTLEKTVTPAVERIYRAEVEKLTFSTTSDNAIPAPTSSGTITFIIKFN